jgi:hypothetical protein
MLKCKTAISMGDTKVLSPQQAVVPAAAKKPFVEGIHQLMRMSTPTASTASP